VAGRDYQRAIIGLGGGIRTATLHQRLQCIVECIDYSPVFSLDSVQPKMKLVYDPWMIRDRSFEEICRFAAEAGYSGIELSPRDDFLPLFVRPVADSESIARLKRALTEHRIELSSVWTVYRWADPTDVAAGEAAVQYFKRFVEVAQELGCQHISSEFGGKWDEVDACRDSFLRSIEQLLPAIERAGITLSLDAHPGDWVEDGRIAVNVIKALNTPHIRFLYSAPHTFYLDSQDNLSEFLHYVAPYISFIRVADTFDHRPAVRYIVNPPGVPVRVHQHLNIGEGEIDWITLFAQLKAIGYQGCLSNSVFAWPDRAKESALLMRRKMAELCSLEIQ
jgi:myo-inositol catabolism protein IolH